MQRGDVVPELVLAVGADQTVGLAAFGSGPWLLIFLRHLA